MKWLKENYRLYGIRGLSSKIIRLIIRPVFEKWDYVIFRHAGEEKAREVRGVNIYSELSEIPSHFLNDNTSFKKECSNNLPYGLVVTYSLNDELVGYGFVQNMGFYHLKKARLTLDSKNFTIMKNLIVFPNYRGRGIARIIHKTRLGAVGEDREVLVFVLKQNIPAIKNLKSLNFSILGKLRIVSGLLGTSIQTDTNLEFELHEKK